MVKENILSVPTLKSLTLPTKEALFSDLDAWFCNFLIPVFNVLRRGSSAMCMLGGGGGGGRPPYFFDQNRGSWAEAPRYFVLIERSKSSVRQRTLHLPEYLNLTRPQSVSHGREEKRLRYARGGGWEGRIRRDSFFLFRLPVVPFVALPS